MDASDGLSYSWFFGRYNSFKARNSPINAWFWLSNTATLFSKQRIYSFFFLLHSLAASLKYNNHYKASWSYLPNLFFISLISLFLVGSSPPLLPPLLPGDNIDVLDSWLDVLRVATLPRAAAADVNGELTATASCALKSTK